MVKSKKFKLGSTITPNACTNLPGLQIICGIEYADGSVKKQTFTFTGEQPVAEFDPKDKKGTCQLFHEYCNLHGLWKAEIEL